MTLTTTEPGQFENFLTEIEQTQKQCKALLQSKHYQAMGEPGVFAIIQKAKSLGINPISALNGGLYYVQGKVGMSTEMMATLIRKAGHSISKDPKSDNSICILHGKRADNGDTWTCSFSIEDAKRAGLFKNMYEKYPSIMIYNRCCSMLARQLFPDVIDGCGYTFDELKEIAENKPYLQPRQELEVSEVIEPKISHEQVSELKVLLSYCSDEYVTKVLNVLKQPPHNANSLEDVPRSLFEKIKLGAIKNATSAVVEEPAAELQPQQG